MPSQHPAALSKARWRAKTRSTIGQSPEAFANRLSAATATRSGEYWTEEDDTRLWVMHIHGIPVAERARELRRTAYAIEARLKILNRLL